MENCLYFHLGLQMDSDLDFMKELSWVLQLGPLKDMIMTRLMINLVGSYWDEKTELYWDLQMELQMD